MSTEPAWEEGELYVPDIRDAYTDVRATDPEWLNAGGDPFETTVVFEAIHVHEGSAWLRSGPYRPNSYFTDSIVSADERANYITRAEWKEFLA